MVVGIGVVGVTSDVVELKVRVQKTVKGIHVGKPGLGRKQDVVEFGFNVCRIVI